MHFLYLNELRERRDPPEVRDGLPVGLVVGPLHQDGHDLLDVDPDDDLPPVLSRVSVLFIPDVGGHSTAVKDFSFQPPICIRFTLRPREIKRFCC